MSDVEPSADQIDTWIRAVGVPTGETEREAFEVVAEPSSDDLPGRVWVSRFDIVVSDAVDDVKSVDVDFQLLTVADSLGEQYLVITFWLTGEVPGWCLSDAETLRMLDRLNSEPGIKLRLDVEEDADDQPLPGAERWLALETELPLAAVNPSGLRVALDRLIVFTEWRYRSITDQFRLPPAAGAGGA